jgi:hypothetical protein
MSSHIPVSNSARKIGFIEKSPGFSGKAGFYNSPFNTACPNLVRIATIKYTTTMKAMECHICWV